MLHLGCRGTNKRCMASSVSWWSWFASPCVRGTSRGINRTIPSGQTYVTTPGSALLFPTLCAPTGDAPALDSTGADRCGDKTVMMPLRTSTRAQNRAHRIAAERRHTRQARPATLRQRQAAYFGPAPPGDSDDEPPPF
jgi:hypothetical protein